MQRDEMVADLQATVDYVGAIGESSDKFDFETLTDVHEALGRAKAAIEVTMGLLNGELVKQLEGGERVYDGVRYYRTRKYTERTNHDAVLDAVVEQAAYCDGVMRAARFAAEKMRDVYLSKSVTAKKGEVDKLSIARDAVFAQEFTGWKVESEEVPGEIPATS